MEKRIPRRGEVERRKREKKIEELGRSAASASTVSAKKRTIGYDASSLHKSARRTSHVGKEGGREKQRSVASTKQNINATKWQPEAHGQRTNRSTYTDHEGEDK